MERVERGVRVRGGSGEGQGRVRRSTIDTPASVVAGHSGLGGSMPGHGKGHALAEKAGASHPCFN